MNIKLMTQTMGGCSILNKWGGVSSVSWCFEPSQPQRITSGLINREEESDTVSESDGNTALLTVKM